MHTTDPRPSVCFLVLIACAGCASPSEPLPEPHDVMNKKLAAAIRAKDAAAIAPLIRDGADPNATIGGHNEGTPLAVAAAGGNLDVVHALIAAGAKVNLRSDGIDGTTPLMIAAASGNAEITQFLIEAGANVHARRSADDALLLACYEGHVGTTRLLLLAGAQLRPSHLSTAIMNGQPEVVDVLLRSGADPSWRSYGGKTMLEEAKESPEPTRAKIVALIRQLLPPHQR
jgi:uncharacterized protein